MSSSLSSSTSMIRDGTVSAISQKMSSNAIAPGLDRSSGCTALRLSVIFAGRRERCGSGWTVSSSPKLFHKVRPPNFTGEEAEKLLHIRSRTLKRLKELKRISKSSKSSVQKTFEEWNKNQRNEKRRKKTCEQKAILKSAKIIRRESNPRLRGGSQVEKIFGKFDAGKIEGGLPYPKRCAVSLKHEAGLCAQF